MKVWNLKKKDGRNGEFRNVYSETYSLFHIKGIFGVTIVFYFKCALSIYH